MTTALQSFARSAMRARNTTLAQSSPKAALQTRSLAARFVSRTRTLGLRHASSRSGFRVMALSKGDKLPGEIKLSHFDSEGNMQELTVDELTKGKKVVLFAVPGAFTPTCSSKHLPGFVEKVDEFKAKGVDTIACVAVNDAFVMNAWSKSAGIDDKILMLADGSAEFAKAAGVEIDLSDKGLGIRSRRYALFADDGVVKDLNIEEGGAFTVSSAEELLSALP